MDLTLPLWAAVPAAIASITTGWFAGIYAVKSKKIDASAALVERLTGLWEAGLAREAEAYQRIAGLQKGLAEESAARIRLEASIAWCRQRCGSMPPPPTLTAAIMLDRKGAHRAAGSVSLSPSAPAARAPSTDDGDK